jgi:glycosyltransferase involved in cell wall biosynthesis
MTLDVLYAGTLPPHPCGAAIACSRTLAGLAALGHRIRAVAPITGAALQGGDPFARSCPAIDVHRFLVPHFHPASPLASDEYRRLERAESLALVTELIAEKRPDVVIVGRESFAWDIPELAAQNGVPCIVVAHGGTTFRMLDRGDPAAAARRLLRQLRAASRVVAPASHLVRRLRQLGLTNVALVPNAVDLEKFHPAPRNPELARSLAIGNEDFVVVHLSNLAEVKRPLDVVESAALALRRRHDLVYVVVGDGPHRPTMEKLCAQKGIASRFRFVGWVDYGRVPDYVRLADVVLVTSAAEGQALVYLEAQACGRTLVASDIPAAREVVTHARTGLLFRTGDVDDLTATTLRAADDSTLRQSIGRQASRRVKRHSHHDAIGAYAALVAGLAAR